MVGFFLTLLFAVGSVGFGQCLLKKWLGDHDVLTRIGVGGVVGLGAIGTSVFVIGLLPSGLKIAFFVAIACALFGLFFLFTKGKITDLRPSRPEGALILLPILLGLLLILGLMGVLSPSTTVDWDSLAYHLAAPKLWLSQGQITFVSYDHHTNFPLAVDSLFILGLQYGGEAGAKAFSWCFYLLGMAATFGIARGTYGAKACWWATLGFATMPVLLWESGTAYIDLANGLFVGLGVWFGSRFVVSQDYKNLWISAILLGLGVGSKYTGLQVLGVAWLLMLFSSSAPLRGKVVLAGLLAIAIGCPGYLRNIVNTGNPIYPFLYSKLGGKNWDAFSEKIYTEEQNSFGVGRNAEGTLDPTRIGHSILGLGYQPGRFTNPQQKSGGGFPFQAIGFAALFALLAGWVLLPQTEKESDRKQAKTVLSIVTLTLVLWFALSQQSRYLAGLFIPVMIVGSGLIARVKLGQVVAGAIGLQAGLTLYLHHSLVSTNQMKVVLESIDSKEYRNSTVGFAKAAVIINDEVKPKRIALFNELFGFLLDVPYYWANPGHSTEIGYDQLKDGKGLAESLKRLGCSHVYLNLSKSIEPDGETIAAAIGLGGQVVPVSAEEVTRMSEDLRNRWKLLVIDAVVSGSFVLVKPVGRGLIFEIR